MTFRQIRLSIIGMLALFGLVATIPTALAEGHGGGWHGGGGGWHGGGGWYGGHGWYGGWGVGAGLMTGALLGAEMANPYPYYYPAEFPYTYPQAVMVQQAAPVMTAPATSPPANTWYYCDSAKAFYPYVSSCPQPWRTVPAVPPGVPAN